MGRDCRYSDSLRKGPSGDRNPVAARFSAPSLLCDGYRVSLPGVKRPGRGFEERIELYLYFHLRAFMACSRVNFTVSFFKDPGFMQVNSTASTGHCSELRLLISRCCQLLHFYRHIVCIIIRLYKDRRARRK